MEDQALIPGLAVRRADADEAPAIARLFTQLGYPCDAGSIALRLHAQGSNDAVLVALREAQVVGVLVLHIVAPIHVPDPWALISALVVDERQRSGGAGALLIAQAHALAQQRGCAHLELSCSETRSRAHDFYAAQGFVEVRKRFVRKIAAPR